MNSIYRDAILKASEVRKQLTVNMFQPINIFDSCIKLNINLKFIDVNIEGLYVNQGGTPTILISNQRPFPRRCFTAAHELGHHIFKHGLKLDILIDDRDQLKPKDNDEILVDAFAAALLMPVGGIQVEFAKRNWKFQYASPLHFYSICSIFGVGYQTLIIHCKINDLISESKANELMKLTPAKIFKTHFGDLIAKSYFKIIDQHSELSVIDLEVRNYLVLPSNMQVDGDNLVKIKDNEIGCLYVAKRAGICSVHSFDINNNCFIRIQRENYVGFAEYRHFEN